MRVGRSRIFWIGLLFVTSCCAPRDPGRPLLQQDASHSSPRGPSAPDAHFGPLELDAAPVPIKGLADEDGVSLHILETARIARSRSLVTASIPLPPDGVRDVSSLSLLNAAGETIPASFRTLARWGGNTEDEQRAISFLLANALLDVDAGAQTKLRLVDRPSQQVQSVSIERDEESLIVDTGAARFTIPSTDLRLLSRVVLEDGTVALGQPGTITLDGRAIAGRATAEVVADSGVVAEIILRGELQPHLGVSARLRFVAGETAARISLRVENRAACVADDRGQPTCDDIGSLGSRSFDDLSFRLQLPDVSSGTARFDGRSGPVELPYQRSVVLYQDSSGHEHWDALRGFGSRLQSSVRRRESVVSIDGAEQSGPDQSTGWLDLGGNTVRVTIGVLNFWQSFPKSLRLTETNGVEVGVFPREFAAAHSLRAGEQKTHDIVLRFHRDDAARTRLEALDLLDPLHGTASAEWFARTLAAGPLGPRGGEAIADYERYIDCQLTTCPDGRRGRDDMAAPNLFATLERFDVYGYLDYGDLPTDFEDGRSPFNLKYDVIRGLFAQYLATGDERWWNLATAAARHYGDVDILHSTRRGLDGQRRWYEGGAYGHAAHDESGRENPHRNHGRPHPMFAFGTPGLLLGHLLTGDPFLREAGLELSENLFWRLRNSVHEGPCADRIQRSECVPGESCEGWAAWNNERVNANYLNAFLWAYRVTGDRRYLDLLREGVSYQECRDAAGIDLVDRLHFQTAAFRAIGEYQLLRRNLGIEDDPNARSVLRRRWQQLSTTPVFQRVGSDGAIIVHSMDGETAREHNSWTLSAADALAFAAILENNWELFDEAALPLASTGGRDPFYAGDGRHYHFAKEFVNAVGFGQVVRYALWLREQNGGV